MPAIALDSNLLLLLIVGKCSPEQIGRHRRLSDYSRNDFNRLVGAIERVQSFVTTPNVLTEVSNLADFGVREPLRRAISEEIARFAGVSDERYCPSRIAAGQPEYLWLGIADAAWLSTLTDEVTLLTVDTQLYLAAAQRGLQAVNFPTDRSRERRPGQ